jgi:hypothetical protein
MRREHARERKPAAMRTTFLDTFPALPLPVIALPTFV